ncbi:teichoic acid D-Ala incorporation-associated protein DltX [Brochothrix campestris]|uniref:D-Ala-teichoic acid biosynthesis protein n=1 Tax=Brochothrix campestris FSL F6-1037 TaxID=1265861 RepID=W7CJJ8_9LIST|nr:teichoic acid D-Ala incorporation-associated protein DltX [Brochothrix campestris]EUJ39554.1 hypothetical protein BCAMP_07015 [Brochothrix campestris FSL F6-1037]
MKKVSADSKPHKWLRISLKTLFYFAVFLTLSYIYIDNNVGSNFIYNEF